MPLPPATRIGPYEVREEIGAGGMGVVYRARDTKLDREVALKVLPESLAADRDRLARFEREARVLASLNHPFIAQVFGFEQAGDVQAIAMELVEGPTLADIIKDAGGPMPLSTVLPIARQLAEALEAAHDQGIIHRDLKPANIKVREDQTVKVLDFGLAKAMAADEELSGGNAANSPTLTARATELGMILGTAAYMAPEQAKGKRLDKRADVWAFGAVLFEMLTGRRAFEGDDVSETLASVLAREPNLAALPAEAPEPVRRLVSRCLVKDPRKRIRDIGDAVRRMDEELSASTAATPGQPRDSRGGSRAVRLALPALTLVAGLAAGAFLLRSPSSLPASDVMRFSYTPPAGRALAATGGNDTGRLAISPDGRSIVYRQQAAGGAVTFALRRLEDSNPLTLQGTDEANQPCFSPDGQWIAFVSGENILKKIPVAGGTAQQIAVAPDQVAGLAWAADNTIIFGVWDTGLFKVSAAGGQPEALITQEANKQYVWPTLIEGTRSVVFVEAAGSPLLNGELVLLDLETGTTRSLGVKGSNPKYVSSGHLVYAVEGGAVWAVPFDADSLAVTGKPAPVIDSVNVSGSGTASFDVSDNGRLVYVETLSAIDEERRLAWVDTAGQETLLPAPPRAYVYAWVSPDGSRLALDIRDAERDIWIYDIGRNTLRRLSVTATDDEYGLWTPDGSQVVFSNQIHLFRVSADVSEAPQAVTSDDSQTYRFPNAVTRDGRVIFRGPGARNSDDLFVVPLDGSAAPAVLLGSDFVERNAALSPDQSWMAYQSDLSGTMEVYARPFPDVNSRIEQISTGGGGKPAWSRDGKWLFYLDADLRMMRVPVGTSPAFSAGTPEALFDASKYFVGTVGRNYDVTPDGRFVMVARPRVDTSQSAPITVVLNWLEELRDIR